MHQLPTGRWCVEEIDTFPVLARVASHLGSIMPLSLRQLVSWIKLQVRCLHAQHLLLACARWWKVEGMGGFLNRLMDLKWDQSTSQELGEISQGLQDLASKVEVGEHSYREEIAEELRDVAQIVDKLHCRWDQHLCLKSTVNN